MRKYKVLEPISLFAGEIKITAEQAAPRMRNLKKLRFGSYQIQNKIMFKAGEEIELKNAPKVLLKKLEKIKKSK
jgi:hypothetical protein